MLGFSERSAGTPIGTFRTVEIERDTTCALRCAVRWTEDALWWRPMHREGRVFTSAGALGPSGLRGSSSLNLSPGDVVVMSGGNRDQRPPCRCLCLSGRAWFFWGTLWIGRHLAKPRPGIWLLRRPFRLQGSEIARTLADLHSSGIEATYIPAM